MISIISALYKSERYLAQYIIHVRKFAKRLTDKKFLFEIIIVPTNSSSKELELIAKIKNESWCKIIPSKELGLYKAWNIGFSFASGDILSPWNVDDIRFPEAVMEAQSLIEDAADIVYFPFYIKRYLTFGPISFPVITRKVEGKILEFEKRKFEITMTAGPHFVFTREAYEKVGPFDEQFKIAGDFDWCARAASKNLKFVCGKQFSGIFRVDGHGLSAGANQRIVAENNLIYKRFAANDKVKTIDPKLESQYRLDKMLFNGQWLNYPKTYI